MVRKKGLTYFDKYFAFKGKSWIINERCKHLHDMIWKSKSYCPHNLVSFLLGAKCSISLEKGLAATFASPYAWKCWHALTKWARALFTKNLKFSSEVNIWSCCKMFYDKDFCFEKVENVFQHLTRKLSEFCTLLGKEVSNVWQTVFVCSFFRTWDPNK